MGGALRVGGMGDGEQRNPRGGPLDGGPLNGDWTGRRGWLAGGAGDPTGQRREGWRGRGERRAHDGHRDGQGEGRDGERDDPPAGAASPGRARTAGSADGR